MTEAASDDWLATLCGHLKRVEGLECARFHRVHPALPLSRRLPKPLHDWITRGAAARSGGHRALWPAILGLATEQPAPPALLAAALVHRPVEEAADVLDVSELTPAAVSRLAGATPAGRSLVLSSLVTAAASVGHLGMLDFGVAPSPTGTRAAVGVVRALGVRGILVNSGRSYHFYGNRVQTADEWRTVLLRACLLAPLVDTRWAIHQLLQGFGTLRISAHSVLGVAPRFEIAVE